ncbi:hypothetical protein A2880_03380 [Candidatus Peribacteria bacterium RIFCSPHIGHO2_01_FULL_49_38]|nr:MAG: hypothetical protein A2880_03380 [Candidatus Peribacteria bacterium RIFCSPHIGHO2_01_FULL_49_38]
MFGKSKTLWIIVVVVGALFLLPNTTRAQDDPQRLMELQNQMQKIRQEQVAARREEEAGQAEKQRQEDEYNNRMRMLAFSASGIIALYLAGSALVSYRNPENVKQRRLRREWAVMEREQRQKEEERRKVLLQEQRTQAKEREWQRKENERQGEFQRIAAIVKDIRAMPRYAVWRQDVFARYGRKCAIGGFNCRTDNLEVDHFPQSLHSLVSRYRIPDAGIQAYECTALWDVNNGAVLCKIHHDQTSSSQYRQQKLAQ